MISSGKRLRSVTNTVVRIWCKGNWGHAKDCCYFCCLWSIEERVFYTQLRSPKLLAKTFAKDSWTRPGQHWVMIIGVPKGKRKALAKNNKRYQVQLRIPCTFSIFVISLILNAWGRHVRLTTGAGKRLEKSSLSQIVPVRGAPEQIFPNPFCTDSYLQQNPKPREQLFFPSYMFLSFVFYSHPPAPWTEKELGKEQGEGHPGKGLEARMEGMERPLPPYFLLLPYCRNFNNMSRIWTFCSIVLYVLKTKSLAQSSQTCNNYQKLDHNFSPHIISICGIRRTYGFMVSQK